ncbi:MAG TPA: integrin alpha, partial [Candidatus Eisenbacteria bacterium]|nr:integrin alpha [Candidatus Eisenbacteria bacterium]
MRNAGRAIALGQVMAAGVLAVGAIAILPRVAGDAEAAAAKDRGALVLSGGVPGETFGCSIAAAGDVNGDGYDDVITGAYQSSRNGLAVGRAYVYYGSRRPVNRADIVLIGEAAGDAFGVCVASAGDMNHDGYADVIVGAYQNDARGANAGRSYVYFGGPNLHERPDLVLNGEAAGDAFGYAVASAGDVNGDGFSDVIVGAYENSARGAGAGRAYVFFGSAKPDAVPDLVLSGEEAGDRFGISVAGAGDVNKDGIADVIVGAYQNDAGGVDAGRAYVFYGGKKLDDHPDE